MMKQVPSEEDLLQNPVEHHNSNITINLESVW